MWGLHSYMPITFHRAKSSQQFWSCFSHMGLIFKGYLDLLETFFILLSWCMTFLLPPRGTMGCCSTKLSRRTANSSLYLQSQSICITAEWLHCCIVPRLLVPLLPNIRFDKNTSQAPLAPWKRFKCPFFQACSYSWKSVRSKHSIITSDLPKSQWLALRGSS